MLMQAFLNCTVKMFRNCKQTGAREHKWKVDFEIRITRESIMTNKRDC